jgi:hypothetical protein
MVGDVNFFLNDPENNCSAEIEIMIAGTSIFYNANNAIFALIRSIKFPPGDKPPPGLI